MDDLKKSKSAHLLLRISLSFIFLYAGIGKLFLGAEPPVEQIITFLPASATLLMLGSLELIIGLLLLFGLITRIAAATGLIFAISFIIGGISLQITGVVPGAFNQFGLWKDFLIAAAAYLLVVEGAWFFGIDVYLRKK